MKRRRRAGILLHPTSFPGRYGIGDLGPEADRFLEWAESAGQGVWQVLPLHPAPHESPYGASSAFAGNTLLISPERLREEGLLSLPAAQAVPTFPQERVDFAKVRQMERENPARVVGGVARESPPARRARVVPRRARAGRVAGGLGPLRRVEGEAARRLDLVAGGDPPPPAGGARSGSAGARRRRSPTRNTRSGSSSASGRGSRRRRIAGASRSSATFPSTSATTARTSGSGRTCSSWMRRRRRKFVAGVPPDAFSETGQLWGYPLYRWDAMERDGFSWWIARLRQALLLADAVRIDHFRGFAAGWSVPAEAVSAIDGRWIPAPGSRLFEAARRALGDIPLVAEDLGVITDDVRRLLSDLGIPGMRVLQFGFSEDDSEHLPHRHVSNSVVYTGTHDNDTARGWFAALSRRGARPGARLPGRRRERHRAGHDPRRVRIGRERGDRPAPGRSRSRERSPHEHTGRRARQLGLASRGSADFTPERAARLRRLAELTGRA